MSNPEVQEIIGGYSFHWEEDGGLTIRVERLRIHNSDGRVTGELHFFNGTNKAIYPPTQLAFGADRSRSSLAKTLIELDPRPWDRFINQVCEITLERARAGEPIEILNTLDDITPPQWLLEPILYKGLPTLIFGEKAVAKSTIALAVYICLALPWSDNPLGWRAPEKPVKCLLLDYEVDARVALFNLRRLIKGMDLEYLTLYYRRGSLPLADDAERIQHHMRELGAEVLIVDSLAPALGGDANEAAVATRFAASLRQINCSTLIIGQTSKAETKRKSVFGSTLHEYFARVIFELRKVQEEGEDSLDVALFNTYHNLGKLIKAQGFRISYNNLGATIESCAITAPELVARLGANQQILKALSRGALMPKDISDRTGIALNNVSVALGRLKAKGQVLHIADGWCLPSKEPE